MAISTIAANAYMATFFFIRKDRMSGKNRIPKLMVIPRIAPRENEIINGKLTMNKTYPAFGNLKKIILR